MDKALREAGIGVSRMPRELYTSSFYMYSVSSDRENYVVAIALGNKCESFFINRHRSLDAYRGSVKICEMSNYCIFSENDWQ